MTRPSTKRARRAPDDRRLDGEEPWSEDTIFDSLADFGEAHGVGDDAETIRGVMQGRFNALDVRRL